MFKPSPYTKIIVSLFIFLFTSLPASAAVYTYDALNRLTSVIYENGQKIVYTYDPGGNMLNVSHHSSLDTLPPTVKTTDPVDGATNIPVSASVYIAFSETIVEDCRFFWQKKITLLSLV